VSVRAFVLTAGLVADATGGRLIAGEVTRVFDRVVTDSRAMTQAPALSDRGAGALFIALSGPTFDGNDFAEQAIAAGAAGVLVSRPLVTTGNAAVILVDDTLEALQQLGHSVRMRSGARVVAITGSAGKTTTKEATAKLLGAKFRVYRNAGNFNNHWGLPLSLIELRQGPEIAVVELGMNHAGEISRLVRLAAPETRVWTNVGNAHIGHFGSADAIAEAKAEILEDATPNTLVVANADDERVMRHVGHFGGRRLTFGIKRTADVQATRIADHGFDGTTSEVTTPWGPLSLRLTVPGRANLMNVLAAVTVALDAGVGIADVEREAAMLQPVDRRGSSVTLTTGVRLIDDSYNASPAAVRVTVQALAATPCAGRRIAVLGEMRELGDDAVMWHEDCGRAVADAHLDLLIAVGGPAADGLIAGARGHGMTAAQVQRFVTSEEAAAVVADLVRAGDLVLVKGSRGTRTDIIADRLKAVA
jgi:UDP-N-acetylmuramoyl-tripeptide--D-alanyl-D-alanine ligase